MLHFWRKLTIYFQHFPDLRDTLICRQIRSQKGWQHKQRKVQVCKRTASPGTIFCINFIIIIHIYRCKKKNINPLGLKVLLRESCLTSVTDTNQSQTRYGSSILGQDGPRLGPKLFGDNNYFFLNLFSFYCTGQSIEDDLKQCNDISISAELNFFKRSCNEDLWFKT